VATAVVGMVAVVTEAVTAFPVAAASVVAGIVSRVELADSPVADRAFPAVPAASRVEDIAFLVLEVAMLRVARVSAVVAVLPRGRRAELAVQASRGVAAVSRAGRQAFEPPRAGARVFRADRTLPTVMLQTSTTEGQGAEDDNSRAARRAT
jgi:hypothetical protein